ncbi:MAG TPA: hypothetical protein VJR48_08625, partial [Ktedonobacterales bacterium]|nr:hypothetical protein [Ktedonobacterales bacterium]
MDPAAPDTKPSARPDVMARVRRRMLASLSIRQRLALWYATLLALTLVLFSVIVYTVALNQLQASVNEEIRGRAVYIASALQNVQDAVGPPASITPTITGTESPSASASPTAKPTPTQTAAPAQTGTPGTPGATADATANNATPVPTVDPKSSQTIQNQLNKVPSVLGRIDFAVEVLDVKLVTKFASPALKDAHQSLPLNHAVITQALQGTPGMYTMHSTTPGNTQSLLAIYVQPITLTSESVATRTGSDAADATASPTGSAVATPTLSPSDASEQIIGVVLVAKPLDD